ncbi:hypothetical protein BKA19_1270 [Blastococcus saxobsidens]|uniref:Uncharacterized protein n=1 Tax=Blastococcus saxobsidens TaxID=138336 RepID=A0A4Q7Y6N1_9ACTN|nr:hypothetical protein BKA19_1270 [Blastococcus saxobsidens]
MICGRRLRVWTEAASARRSAGGVVVLLAGLAEEFGNLGLDLLVEGQRAGCPRRRLVVGIVVSVLNGVVVSVVSVVNGVVVSGFVVLVLDEFDAEILAGQLGVERGDRSKPRVGALFLSLLAQEVGVSGSKTQLSLITAVQPNGIWASAEGPLEDETRGGVLAEVTPSP